MKKNLIFMSILMIGSQMIGSNATTSDSNNTAPRSEELSFTEVVALAVTYVGVSLGLSAAIETIQPGTLKTSFTQYNTVPAGCAGMAVVSAFYGKNYKSAFFASAAVLTAVFAASIQISNKQ